MERDRVKTSMETETNVYADVYRLLIFGMVVSNALFATGIVLAFLHPVTVPLTAEWVRSQYQVRKVLHGLASRDPVAFMLVATTLLILTPVARVVVSIAAFLSDKDYKFVVVTSIVLLVMAVTVVLGWFGLQ